MYRNKAGVVHVPTRSKSAGATPTKEDILNTLEQFGWNSGSHRGSSGQTTPSDTSYQDDMDGMVIIEDTPKPGGGAYPHSLEDFDSISMSTSYSGEWEKLFMKPPNYMKTLREYGMQGKLRSTRFRSVCWKLYLEVLPESQDDWLPKTRVWRQKYEVLKNTLIVNPRKAMDDLDLSVNNPLSQETESPWNQFFQDNELRLTIKQDVVRTFPELEFFKDTDLRDKMVDILFCYCRQHLRVGYKQGMHELLAPLIFVLHCDHQAYLHACEIESVKDILQEILDPAFIEHDAFALFCQIMETVEPWYVSKEISPTIKMNNVTSAQPFAKCQDLHPSNVIVTKLTRIQDYLLKKADPDLHSHMEKMEIAPQIYGIRWVRLLFGREFPMQDLLMLWDAVFAESISFDLVDYIFVAMLLYIREAMLTSDYASCLGLLMKFPPVGDVHYFIDKALYLREPNQQPKPREYVYHKPQPQQTNGMAYRMGSKGGRYGSTSAINFTEKASSVVSGFSSLTRGFKRGHHRPKTLGTNNHMAKSTSEPMNLLTDDVTGYTPDMPYYQQQPIGRKGSTASLSQIEDQIRSHPGLRPTMSSQSLARLETASQRSGGSNLSLNWGDQLASPGDPYMPSPGRAGTLPGRGSRKNSRQKGADFRHDLALIFGRINDMESMCAQCADKMDMHIKKLQSEMLHQQLDHEDEILLSIAGLKQVRDVLKGTLRASTVFGDEEIHIEDNHYVEDSVPMLMTPESVKPMSQGSLSQESPIRAPYPITETLGNQFYVSSAEVSDTDTSPEQGEQGGKTADSSPPSDNMHSSPAAKMSKKKGRTPSAPQPPPPPQAQSSSVRNIPTKPEIELKSFQQQQSESMLASSPDVGCGSPKSYGDHWPEMMTTSWQERRSIGRQDSAGSDVYDSNQNTRRQKAASLPRKSSVDNNSSAAGEKSSSFTFARNLLRGYRN